MSILKEKDLESGCEPFPDFIDDSTFPDEALHSTIRIHEPRPLIIRYLPHRQQLYILDIQSRFNYYWNYPIRLPAPIERAQSNLQQWWHHPLPASTPKAIDAKFQRWWLAPEHVWRRRRWRSVWLLIFSYFVIFWFLVSPDLLPPEAQRQFEEAWEKRMDGSSCRLLGCAQPAWDVWKEVVYKEDEAVKVWKMRNGIS